MIMATIRANGTGIPLSLPLDVDGKVIVHESLLSAKFGFLIGRMYVEQEVVSESGEVIETILQLKTRQEDGDVWILSAGLFKVLSFSDSELQ